MSTDFANTSDFECIPMLLRATSATALTVASEQDRQSFQYALTFNKLTAETIVQLIERKFLERDTDGVLRLCEGRRVLVCASPLNVKARDTNADIAQLLLLAAAYNGLFCAETFGPIHSVIVQSEMNQRTVMPYALSIDWFVQSRVAKAAELAKVKLNEIKDGVGDRVFQDCIELLELIGTEHNSTYTFDDHVAWLTNKFGSEYNKVSRSFHTVSWLNLYDLTEAEKKQYDEVVVDGEPLSHKLRWIPNFFLLFKAVPKCGRGTVSDGVNYACMLAWLSGILENRTSKIPIYEAQWAIVAMNNRQTLPCISLVLADMDPDDWLPLCSQTTATLVYMVKNKFVADNISRFLKNNGWPDHPFSTFCVDPELDNLKVLTGIYFTQEELDAYNANA